MPQTISATRSIVLRSRVYKGLSALVDAEDHDWLSEYTWWPRRRGSKPQAFNAVTTLGGNRKVVMHRLIMKPPADMQVDHVNRDTLDNRRANLRICTPRENNWNRDMRGVLRQPNGDWQAYITLESGRVILGAFELEDEALKAVSAARLYHFGEFAHAHFPDVTPRSAHEIAATSPTRYKATGVSGFRGVTRCRDGIDRWKADICYQGRQIYLGVFDTKVEAALAYDEAAKQLKGAKAHLNFPEGN